jgi:flagellar basal-body rod protein FlgB
MAGRLDDALGFHEASLRLRAQRQQVLASNLANADTPNYKARDIDFKKALASALSASSGTVGMKQSHSAHLPGNSALLMPQATSRVATQNSLDGNTVDMDVERAAFAENALQYEVSVSLANSKIKGLLAVLQG